jgi:hypothetical protein
MWLIRNAFGNMNLYRIESQLASLERLVPHLTRHGCDISAQDAARSLMRYFDDSRDPREDKALATAYDEVRRPLKDIADGRSGSLPTGKVAAFTRCYREHILRAESVLVNPVSASAGAATWLDS